MRSRRARSLLLAVGMASGTLTACSLVTSLSGLSGGDEAGVGPGPAGEAAVEGSPAGGNDAGDGGGREAAVGGEDGGVDAAVRFCDSISPPPTFCDDFDRTTPVGAWDEDVTTAGGAVASVASTRGGGGFELQATMPAVTAPGSVQARVQKDLGTLQSITVDFAFRTDAAPGAGATQLMAIQDVIGQNGDFAGVYLFVRPTGFTLVEQTFPLGVGANGVFIEHALAEPMVFGKWQRIVLTLKLSAPPRLEIKVDGTVSFAGPADAFLRPGKVTAGAGIHYTDPPAGPLSVRIDDLFVVATPQ